MKTTYCKNCNAAVTGVYCQNCGQRSSVGAVTFKETFTDFFATVFSVDAPFVKTIRLLFSNPGRLFRAYLGGQRKTFYKPVAFFILMTVAYVLIRSLLKFDPLAKVSSYQKGDLDTALFVEAGQFMVKNINNILFLFVFSLALGLKLFFYKKFTLAEFVAVSFYLVGAYTVFTTLNLFFMKFVNTSIQFGGMLSMGIYFVFAMVSFFQKKKILVAIKAFFTYIVATIMYALLGFGLSLLILFFKSV